MLLSVKLPSVLAYVLSLENVCEMFLVLLAEKLTQSKQDRGLAELAILQP